MLMSGPMLTMQLPLDVSTLLVASAMLNGIPHSNLNFANPMKACLLTCSTTKHLEHTQWMPMNGQ
jgi:hypothetical protein